MFFTIKNKGTVSRKYFELIGATNKRERWADNNVIGNKGSGAKLAVIPLLRLGCEVAISSSDTIGPYILKYNVKEADLGDRTAKQIIFDYVGENSFPSQLTLDAFMDWDEPVGADKLKIFKAFREYIANAWDEDKNFTFEEVEKISQAESGKTFAFITITDEIRKILDNFPKYFKFLDNVEPLHSIKGSFFTFSGGAIYPKSEFDKTRLFAQGVLVDCKEFGYSTIFDYSLNDKSLVSEERIIKDFAKYTKGIGDLLMSVTDSCLILRLFPAMAERKTQLELDAIGKIKHPPDEAKTIFNLAWTIHFGANAVIAANNTQVDEDAKNKGYLVISDLPHSLIGFLKRCGIKSAFDIAPIIKEKEAPTFERIDLNAEQQISYDKAYSMFLAYFPEAQKFSVKFYRPLHWTLEDSRGHCGDGKMKYKEIWIAEKSLNSVENILTILIHEGRHCLKKAGDYERIFTQAADEQLVKIIIDNPNPPKKNIWEAQVIPQRGIIVPKRFAQQKAHILVQGNELRIKIGNSILQTILPSNISGHLSKERRVSKFKKLASIFLPSSITRQLPKTISLAIN